MKGTSSQEDNIEVAEMSLQFNHMFNNVWTLYSFVVYERLSICINICTSILRCCYYYYYFTLQYLLCFTQYYGGIPCSTPNSDAVLSSTCSDLRNFHGSFVFVLDKEV